MLSHTRSIRTVALATILLALAGCATDDSLYPSLARRDAERMTGSAAPALPEAPTAQPSMPLPADLPGRLAAIEANARKSHATFVERESVARRRVARGAEPGSLAWSDAEVALSSLESARSDTMFALADLDTMLANGAVSQAETGINAGLPEIAALRDSVAALVGAEDAVLADLRGR